MTDMVFPKPSDMKAAGAPAVHFRASRRAPGGLQLAIANGCTYTLSAFLK